MNRVVRSLLAICVMTLTIGAQVSPKPSLSTTIQNGDFKDGPLNQQPNFWIVTESSLDAGFQCKVVEDPILPDKRAAVLFQQSEGVKGYGNLMQIVDAAPYRGKRIRLKGLLRIESKGSPVSEARLWLRVDCSGQKQGFFDNMGDRPLRAKTWTHVEIIGDVSHSAQQMAVGVLQFNAHGERVWVAKVSLEVLGDTPVYFPERPKALTQQGLQNLKVFTRALAYVRFFHPSDEAFSANWNQLSIEGVRKIEGAKSVPDLVKRLQVFFGPYAPSAKFLTFDQAARQSVPPSGSVYIVRWKHVGFGQNNPMSCYRSDREFIIRDQWKIKGWSDPRSPSILKLSDSVRLMLPTSCYADLNRCTLPKAILRSSIELNQKLPEPTVPITGAADDRATRLGDVATAWGVLQQFYPYFDVVNTDWDNELTKALMAAAQDQGEESFTHTLRRMVASLKDGHAEVLASNMNNSSIPSLLLVMLDGLPVVKFTGVSARAIPIGSYINKIDGEPTEKVLARLKMEISAASEGWMNERLAQEFLLGAAGSKVAIQFRTPSGETLETILTRDANRWTFTDTSKSKIDEINPGIWYLDLSRVSVEDFNGVLQKISSARGVIFDLRRSSKFPPIYLEHLTEEQLASPRWNIPLITEPDRKDWDTSSRWYLQAKRPLITGKVAFLVGGGTISSAETCLSIVEAYKLAEIVGEPTAGTNGDINPFSLPGGYVLTWTGMKVLKHDGSTHHGIGIQPTVIVRPTIRGLATGRDEVLEKGILVVSR